MEALDLTDVPVIDEHCHGFYRTQQPADVMAWRRHFTESADERIWQEHVPSALFYHRLMRELATFFGCEATESAVLDARNRYQPDDLVRSLLRAGNIETLLIDRGYPAAELLMPDAEVAALAGCRVGEFLRLENLMQEMIA
ncbi:MAG TPA: hypothetical protein VFS83_03605, partial [Ktedonobacterales bacterium]|nr:hypothetical protein [Ktedonobacterales bacterium]